MIVLFYYPLILLSIVGYGAFFAKKVLSIDVKNLGYYGLLGIFFFNFSFLYKFTVSST